MGLVPAILVPRPELRPVVQQGLAAGSVAPCQYSVVQRGQATAVSVVWRRSEGQENLERWKKSITFLIHVGVQILFAYIDKLRKEEKERNKERIVYMARPYFNCDAAADQYKIKF